MIEDKRVGISYPIVLYCECRPWKRFHCDYCFDRDWVIDYNEIRYVGSGTTYSIFEFYRWLKDEISEEAQIQLYEGGF